MVVRYFVLASLVLFSSFVARAEHAIPPTASTRVVAPGDLTRDFLEKFRDGKLTRAERERFTELLAKKETGDRDFVLALMGITDAKMKQSFGKLLLTNQVNGLSEADLPYEIRAQLRRDPEAACEKVFAEFVYLLVTDPRVAQKFRSPFPKPPPPRYDGPSIGAAPVKSEWEKRRDDPLQRCYRQCAHDKIYMYGPWWGLNPGGGPYAQCIAECNWDYKHGKLY